MTSGSTRAAEKSSVHPGALRRIWNRALYRLVARETRFVYSPGYRIDLGATPIDLQRAEKILGYLLSFGMLPISKLLRPDIASLADLRLAHSDRYLDDLRRSEVLSKIVGAEVWPDLHDQALRAQRVAVGGTCLATREALRHRRTVVNLGGGFHHAGRHSGGGFCIFNDVAIAILTARRDGFQAPVLVVDLDIHDGNGTREIFAEDESVFTLSIHNRSWDLREATASISLELGDNVEDRHYLETLHEHLPPLLGRLRPGLVILLAGTDPAADDHIGNWDVSPAGMLARDQFVVRQIRERFGALPFVILLAGGYGNETWRYSARTFGWLLTGREPEPPSTQAITLARYRHLVSDLQGGLSFQSSDNGDWSLSPADLGASFSIDASHTLFLGIYSRHDIELAVEWTGLLDRLREMGFTHPDLEIDLTNPSGDTIQLFAGPDRTEILMELRLRTDRRVLPGMDLLVLEWLLLQNPRASFSEDRPRLPGQQHPGLGLVPDVMSLLILICDRLDLDGILFTPSHFHLAVKAHKYLLFLYPEDEAFFLFMGDLLADTPLEIAADLAAAGVSHPASPGSTLEWRPMPMVLPISDALHDLTTSPERHSKIREERRRLAHTDDSEDLSDAPRVPADPRSESGHR